jgi:hypothetical protein
MRVVLSAATGVARFLYRFIVGDDWTVAAVMLLGLVATALLTAQQVAAWWLVPLLAIVMTGVSLLRSARSDDSRVG